MQSITTGTGLRGDNMQTHFVVADNNGGENYIYMIPPCDLPRLQEGETLELRQYKKPNPADWREKWIAKVCETPKIHISWSRSSPDKTAYEPRSVIVIQEVKVKVLQHTSR